MENISSNSQIKILNDSLNTLKTKLSNYEIEKNKLILTSNEKDKDLKEIKQKLSQVKSDMEKLKKIINQKESKNKNNNISYTFLENEQLQKNKESNSNLLLQLQNKITDLELQLKKKESKFRFYSPSYKNIFLSPLKNTKNISIFIPSSLNKKENSQNIWELFLTGYGTDSEMDNSNKNLINSINEVKQDNHSVGKGRIKIESELKKLTNEKNNLLQILKNKNKDINDKLEQQNKISKDLIEILDKNKKIRTIYKKIIIKNKNLENEKKLLEDIILQQENKVLKLSKSFKNVVNLMNDKKEEIHRNKKYIFNLEEIIKKYKRKYENINNNGKQEKLNEFKNIKDEYKNIKVYKDNTIPENYYGKNIYNKKYHINSPRSPDYFKIRQKLFFNHIEEPSSFNSFNLKTNKNKKLLINNYSYKIKNNMQKIYNNNIRYKFYRKNIINIKTKLLKHNKSIVEIKGDEKKNISIDNNNLSNHSLNINKKIINYREDPEEKQKIEDFKSFFNKFIEELENN